MKRSRAVVALILALIVVSSSLTVNVTLADPAQPHGVISLTFDDGWQNQYDNAFPLLQARGMVGTFYVVTSQLTNNPTGTLYMTYPELRNMQNYGCEIGSHSVDHPDFTTLTESQIRQECQDSKTALQSHGLTVNNFAYPWGAYNGFTDPIVADYYRSARDVYNPDVVLEIPYLDFHLPGDAGDNGDPGLLSSIESIVDQVYSTNEWAVIYFHQVLPNDPNSPELINTQTLASFLDYIQSKGVPTVTVNQALDLVSAPALPPSVTINPTSFRMYMGQSVAFSSSISGGNPAFSYQWYLNNNPVAGATSSTWIFTPSSTGNYVVYLNVIDGLRYQVQSNIASDIEVHSLPSVAITPSSTSMTVTTTRQFTSTATGIFNTTDTIGDTTHDSPENDNNAINTNQLIPTASGNSLTVGVNVKTPAGQINAAIYSDNNGQPGSLLGASTSQTAVSGWNDLTVSNVNIQAGVPIWVAFQTDNQNCDIYYSTTGGTLYYASQTYGLFPTSPTWVSWATWVYNMRITYNGTTTSGGFPPYTYQWYYTNGTAIAGARASTLNYKANSTGVFNIYLNITDSLNTVAKSNIATITIYSQPTVTIYPTTASLTVGKTQQFTSIESGGLTPYTYQWYYSNGTALAGATTPTLTYKANTTGTINIYLNITDNLNYQTQSNTAILSVYTQPSTSINPTTSQITVGTTQQFTSTTTGGLTPYTYQWYYTNGTAISGSTTSILSFKANSTGTFNVYLNVTDNLNAVTQSNIATLTVYSQPTATISPTTVQMTNGTTQTVTSTVSGGLTPYTYQWFYTNGTAISGATISTLTFKANSTGTFNIYLKATDSLSAIAQSNTATITVYSQPSVTITPATVQMTIGTTQTFSSTATGGLTPYAYQWYYTNGTTISGATTSTLAFKANQTGTFNIYLNVTDSLNAKTQSNTATITVYSQPSVTITPTNVQITVGTTQTFTSTVSGGLTPYTYQWYYTNGTAISGATTSTLTFKANQTGTFSIYLKVTDNLNTSTQSNTATITVYTQPSATIAPTTVQMTIGTSRQFTSTTTGGLTPYLYQWYLNDSAVSAATSSTWNFNPATTGHYKIYLNLTDALSYQVQSNIVTDITVNPQATVTISPTSTNRTIGGAQTFSSTATGGTTPYSYQWYMNSTAVSGETNPNYTFIPTTAGTYNIYLNITDNSAITTKSNTATAKVETPTTVNITPAQTKMYTGQTQIFTSSISGGTSPYTYQWYLNDTAVPGATDNTWTFAPRTAGHYKVYLNVTDAYGFKAQSNINNALVCSVNLLLNVNPTQNTYLHGKSVTFKVQVFNQLDPTLTSSLTLTITGPSGYGYFDVQPISVPAGTVREYTFSWVIPNVAGTYIVEVGVSPSQLSAYDAAWLKVN